MTQDTRPATETTALMMTAPENELPGLAEKLAHEMDVIGGYRYRDAQAGNLADAADRALSAPPQDVQWRELTALAERDAAAGVGRWGEIKEAARKELKSGDRAWATIAPPDSTPMDRARFLVLRGEFMRDWKPSGAIEGSLIDQIAQALTMQLYWTGKLTQRSHEQAAADLRDREKYSQREQQFQWGEWIPERVSEKEMIEEAQANVERWNRMYVRLLRTLRDLRRYSVTIQNAGQVNIADKQVNVSQEKAPAKKRKPRARRLSN